MAFDPISDFQSWKQSQGGGSSDNQNSNQNIDSGNFGDNLSKYDPISSFNAFKNSPAYQQSNDELSKQNAATQDNSGGYLGSLLDYAKSAGENLVQSGAKVGLGALQLVKNAPSLLANPLTYKEPIPSNLSMSIFGKDITSPQNSAYQRQQQLQAGLINQKQSAGGALGDILDVSQFMPVEGLLAKGGELLAKPILELLGKTAVEQTAKDVAEQGAKTVAEQGVKQTFKDAALTGAKVGTLYGAGYGTSGAMQNNANISDILKQSAFGGITGAAGGAVLGSTLYGIGNKLATIADNKLMNNIAKSDNPSEIAGMLKDKVDPAVLPSLSEKLATISNPAEIKTAIISFNPEDTASGETSQTTPQPQNAPARPATTMADIRTNQDQLISTKPAEINPEGKFIQDIKPPAPKETAPITLAPPKIQSSSNIDENNPAFKGNKPADIPAAAQPKTGSIDDMINKSGFANVETSNKINALGSNAEANAKARYDYETGQGTIVRTPNTTPETMAHEFAHILNNKIENPEAGSANPSFTSKLDQFLSGKSTEAPASLDKYVRDQLGKGTPEPQALAAIKDTATKIQQEMQTLGQGEKNSSETFSAAASKILTDPSMHEQAPILSDFLHNQIETHSTGISTTDEAAAKTVAPVINKLSTEAKTYSPTRENNNVINLKNAETGPAEKIPVKTDNPTENVSKGGETPSKIAKSVEAKAVEEKLTNGFKDVAGYDKINIKDQAEKATGLINSDILRARSILRGEQALPDGLKGTALITAMEEHIKNNPSGKLAYELANSPLVSKTSEAAQEMRLMAERDPDSGIAKTQEIQRAQRAASNIKDSSVSKIRETIKGEASKTYLPKEETSWDNFLNKIQC
jgi:hypothetical protein